VKRLTILLIAILALMVAGCANESASASASAVPTQEPTPEPTETPPAESDGGGLPSLEPGAGDLADLLPTEVGGFTLTYQSAQGEEVLGSSDLTPEERAFFESVGASPSDLSSAFGIAFDQSGQGITIVAFRVAGADTDQMRDAFLSSMQDPGEVGEETTVAGKTVTTLGSGTGSGYLYAHDDVIFIVGGDPPSLVEEALAALP
jgi:hypothetical protein